MSIVSKAAKAVGKMYNTAKHDVASLGKGTANVGKGLLEAQKSISKTKSARAKRKETKRNSRRQFIKDMYKQYSENKARKLEYKAKTAKASMVKSLGRSTAGAVTTNVSGNKFSDALVQEYQAGQSGAKSDTGTGSSTTSYDTAIDSNLRWSN